MKTIHNILTKIFLILALGAGWGSSAYAQVRSIDATFNNPSGNSNWANVEISSNAKDASDASVAGVTVSVNGTAQLKQPNSSALTSEFLGPNLQTGGSTATTQTYTFTINGLPEGSSFDNIALPLKAVNGQGNHQNTTSPFQVNVVITVTDGTEQLWNTTLSNFALQNSTSGEVHENITANSPSHLVTNTGTMVVTFTISKGEANPGCFMAFHGLKLTSNSEPGVDVDCTFDPAAGTVSDLSMIKVSHEDSDIILIAPTDYNTLYPTQPALPIVLPRLTKQGAEDIIADSFASSNGYEPYKITFSSEIPDGDYTLILPQGTLYRYDFLSGEVTPVSEMTVNYTFSTAYPLTPTTEYSLSPANGTKVAESLSEVAVTITLDGGKTVQSAKEKNGTFTADELPYLVPSSALSNHRSPSKAAPAGAIVAADVEKTADGVYSISFSPAVTADDVYTLVVPKGAFYVSDGGSELPTAELRATYTVGDPTEWVTIKNARKANGFLSLSAAGLNASEQLTWGVSSAAGAGEYWAFIEDGSNGYRIINKAYGPDYYLGIESTSNRAMIRMYHRSEANDTNTHFDKVASTNTNASGGFCILLHSNHTVGISDWGGSTLQVWAADSENNHKGDQGSGFFINSVEAANVAACPPYNVYKVVIEGAESSATAAYTGDAVNLLGLSTIQNGRYIALKAASGVPEVGNFTVTPALPNPLMDSFSETAATPATLMLYTDAGTMGTNVTLNFVDSHGHPLTEGTVLYKYLGRPVVELSPEINSYNFGGDAYHSSFFTAGAGYTYGGSTFDNVNQTLTFTLTEIVPEWYTMKPNNGGFISSDYANAAGRMHVSNDNGRPTNYAGIWTFKDVLGVDGQNLINAKYYNSRVLSVTGTDGSAVAMMDPVGAIRNDARYKFEIASNGFVQVQGESLYLGNHSMNLVVRGNTPDGSLNLNLTRVPNLGKAVTIVVKDAEDNVLPAGNVVYRSQREDIPTITALLKNGDVYNFGNVPFLTSLFDDSAVSSILNCSYDEEHATLTFVVEQIPAAEWTVVIGGDDNYEVAYNSIVSAHNGEQIILPVDLKAKALTVNAPADKFVWGPAIDKTAKTITFDIRDVATAFTTGLYQMMLLDEAKINTVNGYIDMFAGDNMNTSSKYLYIAPSVYGKDGAKFKFTGVPSYASEAATSVYLTDNGNGTLNLEATGGAKFENVAYSFDADSHILTLTAYGPKTYGASSNSISSYLYNYDPKEMPQLTNQNGPTRYYLYAADTTPYDYYFVDLVNGSGTTTVKYNKPSLTGTTSYADNSLLVVKKGTQFALTDFSPSDTRVLGVEITAQPTSTTPGTLTINLESMMSEWTGIITTSDAGLDITGYQVKFNGATYASGTKLLIPAHLEPREVVSTTCTDKFVWGPIVDEDAKTLTFEIRPVPATLEPGFYQFMLIEDPDNTNAKNRANVAEINARIKNNGSSSINTTGSYIYVMPPYKETSYLAKYNGIPSYGAEPTTFFHITEVGTTAGKLSIQNVKGYYSHDGGRADKTATTTAGDLASYTFNAGILGLQRWVPGGYWGNTTSNGPSNAAEGPGVAAGDNGVYHEKYYITKVDLSSYDVYRLEVLDGSDNSVIATVNCGSNLGAPSVITGGYFFFPKDTPITASLFKTIGYSYEGVSTVADAEGIKTITFRAEPGLQNMIVHRQHGVFDQLEATPEALRPTSKNYIQVGDGMLDQPYKDSFTAGVTIPNPNFNTELEESATNPKTIPADYIANDMTMQNTSVFHIYQYVIPGQTTQVVLPFTKGKGDLGGHIRNYQRWYNYKTERPLDNDIIKLPVAIDETHKTTLGGTMDYYRFDNGHSNWAPNSSGQIVRQNQQVIGYADLNIPIGTDELLVAVDASELKDQDGNIGNGNLLEPSLNERIVFHLIDAKQMSSKLSEKGTTTAAPGKKLWWEDHTFYVPRIKRGQDNYDNNADLLPLNMAWTYYFVPNSSDNPIPLLAESTEWNGHKTANYTTLEGNVEITVEGSAAPYLEVGVFKGQYNLGDSPYITTNHFLYYMMKGVENRTSGERSVPDGSQAIIKVYGKNDVGTQYQLARFTLNFVADAEPLAITSVYGQDPTAPISHRSEDYFDNSGSTRVAELTFQNKSVQFDTNAMQSDRNDPEKTATYAFPIDFRRTSYGYSAQNTYGQYKIGTLNYGITYGPAELYRKNIQSPSSTAVKLADDYLFYIDAAETPGQVASVPLEGTLCAGTRLYCYGYIGSTNYQDDTANQVPASVVLNLVGRKTSGPEAGDTKIIASYLPGMISDVAYTNDGTPMRSLAYGRTPSMQKAGWRQDGTTLLGAWQQIGFSFTISEADSHYDEYELQIINNCHSTSGGDYLLDDFTVYANPPRAKMDFSAPLCYDHIPHLKINAPYDLLQGAEKVDPYDPNSDYRISYCFLDHKKYADALALATNETEQKAAFYNALMGNGTASDTYAGGKVTQYRSFWNLSVASTDAGYEAYPDYTFQSALEATSSDVTAAQAASPYASVQAAIFKQMVGSERQIVFATEIGNSLGWEVGEDYDLVFTGGWVTSDFENASNPYNLASGPNQCSYYDTFTVRPSIIVITDMEDTDYADMTVCEGQTVSMSVSLPGLGPDGKSTFLQFMQYDWWIGNGQTVKGGDTSTITPATVHNFNQEKFGTYTTATAEHAAGEPVFLITALKNFRRLYPTAIDLRVCQPKSGIDANGQDVDFTQEEWNCINHYIQPDDNARTPLILGKRAIDFLVRAEDADADHNVYVTIIPIEPLAPFDGTENVIYCPDPQQVAIRIEGKSPHMFNGFTELHDEYPSQMHAVPVRMGLDQFEQTRLSNTGQMGPHHLRIPLRGIKTVNNASRGAKIIKLKHEKVHASDADTYEDFIYLVGSDDPRYSDPNSEDFFMESVDEKTGTVSYRPVGLVHAFNAPHDNRAHMEIGFANNFQPHEGFTYTLKFKFQESIPDDYTDAIAPCYGNFSFDLKIVPKYIQWVADEGNADWNNDRNWARADRDALHAANAASDGTTPLAGYTSNATNYGDDQLYTQIGTAHSFVPMYFTNVLLHDGTLLAPSLNALTPAEMSGGKYVSFVGGLNETGPNATATRFIKYDMLVTPISNTNHWQKGEATMTPLGHADRYHATNKNYGCEPYDSNVCDGLTFEPGTAMYDAQNLNYNKAWVEYELETNRWYTLASPLQDTYAGEWYSPEDGGRQLTPHFVPITYNEALNDRFNPAYYQRSWDKAGEAWIYRMTDDGGTYVGFENDIKKNADGAITNVRVQKPTYLNWSYVYNDVTVPYSNGGFSVNVRYTEEGKDATGGKALVRMPKDDASYLYYQSEASAAVGNTNGQNPDGSNTDAGVARPNGVASGDYTQITRTATHHRLISDALAHDDDPLTTPYINQFIKNRSDSNPYFLVGNPFMAPMNMDQFFAEQTCKRRKDAAGAYSPDGQPTDESTFVSGKYWILEGTKQNVNIKLGDSWISTDGNADAGVVAPLQGFFVQMPVDAATGYAVLPEPIAGATAGNGIRLAFSADVQQRMEVIGKNEDGSPIYGYSNGEDGQANPIYGHKPSLKTRRRAAAAQPALFRITATNGSELESNAVVYFSDKASNGYNTAEDAETLLDGNIADKVSTVFTAADEQALSINSMSTHVTTIPVGVIAPKDDTRTTLRFSGISQLEAVMGGAPHLYDAENDTFQVLDEETAVTVTGTTAGRYFIVSGTNLPFADEDEDDATTDAAGRIYDLRGIRVASPQHGTVTISRNRKEYNK